jgi:inosine-uridine nucleoside N-ribohydrolase
MDYSRVALILLALAIGGSAFAAPRKVIIVTDIGSDIDDAWALAFALECPELSVDSVVVSHGPTPGRARIAAKLLSIAGRDDVPVIVGKCRRISDNGQRDWAKGFVPERPLVADGAHALVRRVMESDGKVTLIPVGPLTDVAQMIRIEPGVRDRIDEIILMGGAAYRGYGSDSPPCAEYNILGDVPAAQTVFQSGIPIVMVGLDVTAMMQPSPEDMRRIEKSDKPLPRAMFELYKAWGHPVPTLFDPMAVAVAFRRDIVTMEHRHVEVTDDGFTRIVLDGEPNAWVCLTGDKPRFTKLFMERVLDQQPTRLDPRSPTALPQPWE